MLKGYFQCRCPKNYAPSSGKLLLNLFCYQDVMREKIGTIIKNDSLVTDHYRNFCTTEIVNSTVLEGKYLSVVRGHVSSSQRVVQGESIVVASPCSAACPVSCLTHVTTPETRTNQSPKESQVDFACVTRLDRPAWERRLISRQNISPLSSGL